jgi:hypothetical protein
MPLPNAAQAVVPLRKLTDYLLSDTRPRGKEKARYLRSYGFTADRADLLEAVLQRIAVTGDLIALEQTTHGTMYVVVGLATTPAESMIWLRTVWVVEFGDSRPRFVTAYPAR